MKSYLKKVRFAHRIKRYDYWVFLCICGKETIARLTHVKSGDTVSCGCYKNNKLRERSFKHGGEGTRLYRIWVMMRSRCRDITRINYHGRGISVCNEWNDFVAFRNWALKNDYEDNLSIDRIDNELGYNPDNCRWLSMADQQRNKRNNIYFNGEVASVASRRLRGSENLVTKRVAAGWSLRRAFNESPRR